MVSSYSHVLLSPSRLLPMPKYALDDLHSRANWMSVKDENLFLGQSVFYSDYDATLQ